MTDEERKAAVAWLEAAIAERLDFGSRNHADLAAKHAATLKAMLAEPRLPEEPTPELVRVMQEGTGNNVYSWKIAGAYRALYAHLTKPKTKTVEVWHVEYAYRRDTGKWMPTVTPCDTREEAEQIARDHRLNTAVCACIRVTGPHQQEVPA